VDNERRRKYDHLSQEVKDYIDIAAREGAKEAINMLYAEIGRAGVRKISLAIGAAVVAVLSWLGIHNLPK
jgi:hypothetical protein